MTSHTISIHHRATGAILYTGPHRDIRAAAEAAVAAGVRLDGADLRRANLANAMLDGAALRQAALRGANLSGANLSEADLVSCDLASTTLYGACLCESALTDCDLRGALCGGTDISGARLERCLFSTLSALQMNFADCRALARCAFHDEPSGTVALFDRAPVVVAGLGLPLAVMDSHVRIGPHMIPRTVWLAIANDNWPGPAGQRPDPAVYGFIRRHARLLDGMIHNRIFDI